MTSRLLSTRRSRSPAWLIAGAAVLSLVPLAFLAYFSVSLAADAVRREVDKRVASTASLSAEVVRSELVGLASLVDAYAQRPTLVRSLSRARRSRADSERIEFHLEQLRAAHEGVFTTFVADLDGRLMDVVPATPGIVGKDFSFRDWYRGVTTTRRPYVSRAYRTQARGRPLVVAAAALVRGGDERPVAILVAAYGLGHLQRFSDQLGMSQDVKLKVTDHHGVLVTSSGETLRTLVSRRADRRVVAALDGRSGVLELETPDGRRLSAFAPVPDLGWTVTASVPADTAFAAIGELRKTVLATTAVLGLILVAGIFLLARALRSRRRAEDAALEQAAINEAVLEASRDGIRMIDPEGNVLVSNRAYEEMDASVFGAASNGSPEDRVEQLAVLATAPAEVRRIVERTRDPDYAGTHEIELAGSGRAFQVYTAPVRERNGELLGRTTVVRDVTSEREAERMKTELMATVSHELRTPLASVLGFAELLSERELDRETQQRYLRTIHGEAR
ncbi:MAG: PAS domain S-box protein, partial [Thermoleophilia bacterium]|nr:PAS domain S-box protein [Thermoleophilia bacterium]